MKTKGRILKSMLGAGAFLLSLGSQGMAAGVSLDVPVLTSYVWRGMDNNKEVVLQTSLTVTYGKAAFNLWGSMDATGYGEEAGYGNRAGEFTELDLTGSISEAFGPITTAGGIISYVFPGVGKTTHELYLNVSAAIPATPAITWYADVDEIKGSYFLASLAQSFPLPGLAPLSSVDLGASLGLGSGSYNRGYFGIDETKLVDLNILAKLPFQVTPEIKIIPGITYTRLLDEEIQTARDAKDYVVGAVNVSLSL